MAISFAAKPMETLKNMNAQSSKHASWVVRVLSPKIIHYTFNSKGQQVAAEKFVCLLVSKDPKQFMFGSVPFNFANKKAAKDAFERFQDGACFRVHQPEFDSKFKTEFMSTSIKKALLMTKPTDLEAIAISDAETLKDIAGYVDLGLSLTQTLDRLKHWQSTQILSGSSRQAQLLNVTGKVQTLGPQKQVISAGRARKVAGVELVDEKGSVVGLSIWDEAYDQVSSLSLGQGITIVGCSAQRDGEEIKLSLWDNAHVLTGGPIAESLTRLDPHDSETAEGTSEAIERLQWQTADPLPIRHGDGFRWQGDGGIPGDPVAGAALSSISEHGKDWSCTRRSIEVEHRPTDAPKQADLEPDRSRSPASFRLRAERQGAGKQEAATLQSRAANAASTACVS